ncbi:MAG TPA: mercuric reductase [Candidatus Binataceae bacterium]|nr:mercuric reductase [Candidatus Binataceae bacterium]
MTEPAPAPSIAPADSHNQTLLDNVHPPDWVNPQPAARYNMVVIGAGTAGLIVAAGAAGLGAKVALIERELMGGDCLNVGCVPSKALLRSARAIADARGAAAFGVAIPRGTAVDFTAVMERMRRLRADLSAKDSASRYSVLGVDVFIGEGRFSAPYCVEVGGRTLRFAHAAIATGTRAAAPPIPGLAQAGYLTNETVFSLTALPSRLIVIGGGPVGCELAQAFARFGSRVALLEMARSILPQEDRDGAAIIREALAREGIEIHEGVRIEGVAADAGGKRVRLERDGVQREIEADEILVAAGRIPAVDGLNLEAAGVQYDRRTGVRVNDRLQTTNARIYAAGDIATPYRFTHVADATARIVIRNALFLGRQRASALTIPWCTYTDPEIAHVGLYEDQARGRGGVRTFVQPLAEVDRAVIDGETAGFVKVHVGEGSDRILGATVVARHAGEMISELTLAMTSGIGLGRIAETIYPYPTQAEAIRKIGDMYNRTRLTPRLGRLFRRWLSWTR